MLAGCGQAKTLAGLALFDTLESAHCTWPSAAPSSYIDDLAHTKEGTEDEVVAELQRKRDELLAKM